VNDGGASAALDAKADGVAKAEGEADAEAEADEGAAEGGSTLFSTIAGATS
jgi:hypothetical protein